MFSQCLSLTHICVFLILTALSEDTQFNQCGEPPPSSNTYRTFLDSLTVEYRCVDNFHLASGTLTRECVDGNYTGEAPVCLYSCGPPLNTSYAHLSYDDTELESTVTYNCPDNSVVTSTETTCATDNERWSHGDQCYPDVPLDRSTFIVTSSVSRLQTILKSTGEPLSASTPSNDDPGDEALFGPQNAIDDNNSTSLLNGGCSSTIAIEAPRYDITLDDYYDIYKIVVTLPDDLFAFTLPKLIIESRYRKGFTFDKCLVENNPVPPGTVLVAVCSRSRYGNPGKYVVLKADYGDKKYGMLQICDIQIYARPLRHIDCGQPDKLPYAVITSPPPLSTKHGEDSKITYQCIDGFSMKKGSTTAYCRHDGYWSSNLQCTDEENLAFRRQVLISSGNDSVPVLTDGDTSSCHVIDNVMEAEFVIDLENSSEVSDVSVTFAANPTPLPLLYVTVDREGQGSATCKTVPMKKRSGETVNIPCQLYPVGRYVTVRVVFDTNTSLEICDIRVHGRIYAEALECYREFCGTDYKGTMNLTVMGIPCQRWDSQYPHNHVQNDVSKFPDATLADAASYCRNPNGKNGVWCYTTNPNITWQYCPVTNCDDTCLLDELGRTYRGGFRNTISGTVCVKWKQANPAMPKSQFTYYDNSTATCRNPSLSQSKPWCYTNTDGSQYDYCHIPSCPTTPEITWSYWVMHENQTLSDLPSAECHIWKRFLENDGPISGRTNGARNVTRVEMRPVSVPDVCKKGKVHHSTVLCWNTTTAGNTWRGAVLECVDCGAPPNVTNATFSFIATLRFSVATYACVTGYALFSGSNTVTCLETGEWETPDMVCEPSCGEPLIVDNAIASNTAGFVNDTIHYTCATGFVHLSGSPEVACLDNVTWEQPDMYCEVDCGAPPPVANTTVAYNSTYLNSIAMYTCIDGEEVQILCEEDGQWENPGVMCTATFTITDAALSTEDASFLVVTSFSLDDTLPSSSEIMSMALDDAFQSSPEMTSFFMTSAFPDQTPSIIDTSHSVSNLDPFLSMTSSPLNLIPSLYVIQPTSTPVNVQPSSNVIQSKTSFSLSNSVLSSSGTSLTTHHVITPIPHHVITPSVSSDGLIASTRKSYNISVDKYGRMRSEVCICRCIKKRMSQEIIKRKLELNHSELTSYRNKKISVPDTRSVPTGIGILSMLLMILMFVLLFANDVISVWHTIRMIHIR